MELYTIADVANKLSISDGTVRKLIHDKKIFAHRIGDQIRISEENLKLFLEKNMYEKEDNKRKKGKK